MTGLDGKVKPSGAVYSGAVVVVVVVIVFVLSVVVQVYRQTWTL